MCTCLIFYCLSLWHFLTSGNILQLITVLHIHCTAWFLCGHMFARCNFAAWHFLIWRISTFQRSCQFYCLKFILSHHLEICNEYRLTCISHLSYTSITSRTMVFYNQPTFRAILLHTKWNYQLGVYNTTGRQKSIFSYITIL